MRTLISKGVLALALVLGISAASPARAVPIVGDYTTINVTSIAALSGASITVAALGSGQASYFANANVLIAVLPVTGGDVDIPTSFAGTIEHSGSGLELVFAGVPIDLTDLVIDTTTFKVNATVASPVFGGVTDIFDLVPCQSGAPGTCQTVPGGALIPSALGLRISANLATVIAASWGLPGLTGFQFGVANAAIRAIPEPTTAILAGAGLVGLAIAGRRRSA
jgi:hypothetical protein